MHTLISWLVDNPVYGFIGFVGLCVGIFYGFDGWRGDTANVDLKDSPRVRNLIWVLGIGFAAFIGDLKALDADTKKPLAMLMYVSVGVIAGAVVVVLSSSSDTYFRKVTNIGIQRWKLLAIISFMVIDTIGRNLKRQNKRESDVFMTHTWNS